MLSPAGAGQVLAPWPNRLDTGRYQFEGTHASAAIDETARNTAIHGLVRWLSWQPLRVEASVVSLTCTVGPQPGYPWRLRLELDYDLEPTTLTVSVRASNGSLGRCPFGIGFHPYLAAIPHGLDDARLEVPATEHLLLDERGLPVGVESPGGGLLVGELRDQALDDCYTGLRVDGDGYWRVRFQPSGPSGAEVVLFADARFGYVMCFTGDTLDPPRRRRGVAVEPMTCPPNALRSGTDLVVLDPGATFSASWGIGFSAR